MPAVPPPRQNRPRFVARIKSSREKLAILIERRARAIAESRIPEGALTPARPRERLQSATPDARSRSAGRQMHKASAP